MKKTYNQPTCIVVELASRDAMLQSVSATISLTGTSFGGRTSASTTTITDADVKEQNVTDVNVWDKEW